MNKQTERTLAGAPQQLWPITAGPVIPKNRISFLLFEHFEILFSKVDLWSGDQARRKKTKIKESVQTKNCLETSFTGPERVKLLTTLCNVPYDKI